MTSFEGDTGPYLQYAHARLCSITRKSELSILDLYDADFSLLVKPDATLDSEEKRERAVKLAVDLVRVLSQWPDVVQNTLKTLEPTTVLTYLFKMTHALSSSYDVLQVVGSEPDIKKARMALYESARQVLFNGMRLLGLNPVDR
jgi:arginyl-tRNA synthetase